MTLALLHLASAIAAPPPPSSDFRSGVQTQITGNMSGFRACYRAGLDADSALGGRVAIRFRIGTDGSVSDSGVESSSLWDSAVSACLAAEMKQLRFPAPPADTSIVFPFVFAPGPEDLPESARYARAFDPARFEPMSASHLVAIEGCYVEALERAPSLVGTVTFGFTAEASGVVSRAEVVSSTLWDDAVSGCAVERLRAFTFDLVERGRPRPTGPTEVVFPISFVPSFTALPEAVVPAVAACRGPRADEHAEPLVFRVTIDRRRAREVLVSNEPEEQISGCLLAAFRGYRFPSDSGSRVQFGLE